MRDYHECDLLKTSESCLPLLPLYSYRFEKWLRKFKKLAIIDENSNKAKTCFRSHSAIIAERKRHANCGHFFTIHPFSKIAIFREHLLAIIWIMVLYTDPLTSISFWCRFPEDHFIFAWEWISDLILFFNIIIHFFIGYYIPLTKEIVLHPKSIAKKYISSYFLVDLCGCIPLRNLLQLCVGQDELLISKLNYFNLIKLIRLLRITSATHFFIELLTKYNYNEKAIKLFTILTLSIYLAHWWACIFYAVPLLIYGVDKISQSSWLQCSEVGPDFSFLLYAETLLGATAHFFGASEGGMRINHAVERLMCSFCLITGCAYTTYLLAFFIQVFGIIHLAQSKYDELVFQLKEYSNSRNLPEELQNQLFLYYEYKFQLQYFKEDVILSTLSEHLRYEILLYSCRRIIEKAMVLQGLSKNVVGGLIANFKSEIFLQNDVIVKHGDPPTKLYFISHGTVAVYLPTGQELTHHEDGDFFGSIVEPSTVNIVAAEITQTFSMSKADARYIFKLEKEVADRINQLQSSKQMEYNALAKTLMERENKNVLTELRAGHILEKLRLR